VIFIFKSNVGNGFRIPVVLLEMTKNIFVCGFWLYLMSKKYHMRGRKDMKQHENVASTPMASFN
jgi:hypothetical protein